jgi:4-hydroxybenzoate polyprenyltransferase
MSLGIAAPVAGRRYLACLRYREVVVLQGSPLLGAAFAMRAATLETLAALALFAAASFLLVAHIFVLNDWAGLLADLRDPNKAAGVFTSRGVARTELAWLGSGLLAASLALFAILGWRPLAIAAAIAALSFLYSAPAVHAKGVPLAGTALHLAGGALHFLLGYSLWSAIDARGLLIALFFALVFAAGHLNQEVGDHDGDRMNGIATTAVRFGRRAAFFAGLAGFTLAFMQLAALAGFGVIPRPAILLVALYPLHLHWSRQALAAGLTFRSIRELQARYRALFAVLGAGLLAARLGDLGH